MVLTTHKGPDGDGIGSEIALLRALRKMGKSAYVLNNDPTPRRLAFLDAAGEIRRYRTCVEGRKLLDDADLVMVVDLSEVDRTGDLEKPLVQMAHKVLVVDHHLPTPTAGPGLIVPDCSSCGELVYRIIAELGVEVDAPTATAIYAAMAYDTASFRYIRNSSQSLRVAAELIDRGADATTIQEALFAARPRDQLTLLLRSLQVAEFAHDGRLAYVILTPKMAKGLNLDREAYREVISHLVGIEGVLVAVTFKVEGGGPKACVRLSLRSKDQVPVVEVAQSFGGGGHAHACGAVVRQVKAEEMVSEVVSAIGLLLPPT